MPRISVATAPNFELTTHPTALGPGDSVKMQRTDSRKVPGRMVRGKGYSRSQDIAQSAATITGGGVLMRRDCRMVVIDSSTAGVWRASMTAGVPGFTCCGSLPQIVDVDTQEGDAVTYVSANVEATTIIYTGATSGRLYEVFASGRWNQDASSDYYWTGPEGLSSIALIGDPGQIFDGQYYGTFMVKQPGSATWIASRGHSVIQATAAGNLLGSFADNIGAFTDNRGFMTVIVRPW